MAAAICALVAAKPACAICSLNFAAAADADGYAVWANNNRVLSLRGASAGAQATAIAKQLQAAAERGGPKDIEIVMLHGAPTVTLDGDALVRVDAAVAAGNNSTPDGLAQLWRERIAEMFAQPFLTIGQDSIAVPLGEARLVPVGGNLAAGVNVSADPALLQGSFDAAQRAIRLVGVGRGRGQATITSGLAALTLNVRVAPWAAAVAPQVAATVTGRVVPRELLCKAAAFAVYAAVQAQPGAVVSVASPSATAKQITQGQQATATVDVSASGGDCLPLKATTTAVVRASSLSLPSAGQLMVSNRPERLPSLGQWYEGRIPAGPPSRLLYHHLNATRQTADLVVELANPAAAPARVHVVEGEAGPSYDEIFVGHAAARTFVKRMAWQVGYVATIPAFGRAVLASHRLPRGAIASGILELAVLEGSDLLARVRLLPPADRPLVTTQEAPQSAAQPFWVFPDPRKSLTSEYTVGGNWAFVSVGREAASGTNHGEWLHGNYGILYEVTFIIHNPLERDAQLEIGFQTAAGAARGVMLIDGALYETGLVGRNSEQSVMRFRAPARADRRVVVQIMPQSGSNYPVRLFCRPAGSGD